MARIEIDVELEDFADIDLIDELIDRGYNVTNTDMMPNYEEDYEDICEQLEKIFELKMDGLDFEVELNSLFRKHLGLGE